MTTAIVIGALATLGVGAVSIVVTLYLARQTTANQGKLREETTANQGKLRELISCVTDLFAVSTRIGIETAYENRQVALAPVATNRTSALDFASRFRNEKKLIVVGSSLLGFKMYVQYLPVILRSRQTRDFESKFMLTHPCFSRLREEQEGRDEKQIGQEIEEMVTFLRSCGMANDDCLRFYRGTPTCFTIITSNSMLLNPYPYQIEAFRSFCIEVRRVPPVLCPGPPPGSEKSERSIPTQVDKLRFEKDFRNLVGSPDESEYDYGRDIGPDIYGQFYWFHYLLPWFSKQAVKYTEYRAVCKECQCLKAGYNRQKCTLIKDEYRAQFGAASASKNQSEE